MTRCVIMVDAGIEMITAVERAVGRSLQDQKDLKKDLRAAWWGVIGGGKPRSSD